jgi:hypothetical protein
MGRRQQEESYLSNHPRKDRLIPVLDFKTIYGG